jgi:Protein of unknown function (DUF541)
MLSFVMVLVTIVSMQELKAQAAGNAIYSNGNNGGTRQIGVPPGAVDLSLNNNYSYNFGTMLEASVLCNVKATSFVVVFSVTQFGKSSEQADSMMTARLSHFKRLLAAENVTTQQVFVDAVSMIPTYEFEVVNKKFSKTLNEVPDGFEMKKNVHVTIFNHDQINRLISVAANAEIYDLVKVDYAIDKQDEILAKMRQDALVILQDKRMAMEKSGISARFIKLGEVNGSAYPFERYTQYYAFKTGVAPTFVNNYKKNPPAQTVQYNYAEKNKTIYYDKVPEKQFDRVINPLVNEPMVQIYLSLKAQYEIFDPVKEKEDKEYLAKQRKWEEMERELQFEERRRGMEQRFAVKKVKE